VLGDLYALMNNDDGAIEHYVMAIDRGDRNPALFRKTYQMLVNRRQFERANQLLAKAGRTQTISTEAAKWGAAWNLGTTEPPWR
jgi:hypothetical protein